MSLGCWQGHIHESAQQSAQCDGERMSWLEAIVAEASRELHTLSLDLGQRHRRDVDNMLLRWERGAPTACATGSNRAETDLRETPRSGDLVTRQQPPVPNDHTPIWDLVIEDMHARDRFGWRKYGTRLQPENGRDALKDLYQELLDAVAYTRQLIEERA